MSGIGGYLGARISAQWNPIVLELRELVEVWGGDEERGFGGENNSVGLVPEGSRTLFI